MFLSVSTAWGKTGIVDILVSNQGLPLQSTALTIDKTKVITDDNGFVSAVLETGDHKAVVENRNGPTAIPFRVVEGERTQLIINLFEDGAIHDLAEPVAQNLSSVADLEEFGEVEIRVKSVAGQPLADVRAFTKGVLGQQLSDRSGLIRLKLPLGSQVISLIHPNFSTQVLRDVKVRKDVLLNKQVQLTPAGLVLDDFVVIAPNMKGSIQALIEVRRKQSSLVDVMSAEQMSKTGDSDAAGSLKRVTGLTLKDGKYVYVRGMGERYSATLLNGIALPSPDPSRRVIPLDLFPVQFLDSMVVQKSFSSDQPGEFGGGVVMLKTKSMPEKFYFKASVSETQNSNQGEMLGFAESGSDWLGIDDGQRKLPTSNLTDSVVISQLFDSMPNQVEDEDSETLPDLSFSVGDRWDLKRLQLGYTLSGLYKDQIQYTEKSRMRYSEQNGELVNQGEVNQTRRKTEKERTLGVIAGLQGALFKDHKASVDFIQIRNTTNYLANLEGVEESGEAGYFESEWAARTLKTFIVQGESQIDQLGGLKVDWHMSDSSARRDEPRRITAKYSKDGPGDSDYILSGDDGAIKLRYYDLQESVTDAGLKINQPLPWFYKKTAEVTLGFQQSYKERESTMNRFEARRRGSCDNLSANPGAIYNSCPDSFEVRNTTGDTDLYTANQQIQAMYFGSRWPLLSSLSLSTGIRFEESVQQVQTIDPLASQDILTRLTTRDWLPGSSLTWKLNDKMQLRFAYNETISRPDLRELSATRWEDFDTGYEVRGNPNLQAAVLKGYDARWEWYFGSGENLSVGGFYKEFDKPIEQFFSAGSDPAIGFTNVPAASIYGVELEFSKKLGFISPWMRRLQLSGNYSYLISEVQLGNIQNSQSLQTSRPLQGQSKDIINFLLDYEHQPYRLNASLSYNVYGRRIAYVAPDGLPNIWEQPFDQLDFVMTKKIGRRVRLQAKFKNILNPEAKFVQGGKEWQGWRKGQSYTLGIAMDI